MQRFVQQDSRNIFSSHVQPLIGVLMAEISQPLSLLRLPAVKARVGLCRSSIYQRIAEGKFPSPISLGARAVAWDSRAVDDWIAERIAQASKA